MEWNLITQSIIFIDWNVQKVFKKTYNAFFKNIALNVYPK